MVGRGTRLCKDLFGPGHDKEYFRIFDYCQNLEYFNQNSETAAGGQAEPLGKKLFRNRVELLAEIDRIKAANPETDYSKEAELRSEVTERLRTEVEAMNVNNFIVRPKRRLVEKYKEAATWKQLGTEEHAELTQEVAGLPSELAEEDQDAKQFDLLILRLQLALLRGEHAFTKLAEQVKAIASALEEKSSIPMVNAQMELILEVQTDEFWQDITTPILENVRKRLRALMKLVEKSGRVPIYTDFEDELGEGAAIELPGFGAAPTKDFEKFRAKTRQFLKEHENDEVIRKLRWNEPLTSQDLQDLEKILVSSGTGSAEDLEQAKSDGGLGLFIRSVVGLDRQAAVRALDVFLSGKTLNGNQIQFISLIIDHLTQRGWINPAVLYESPFTDINPHGVEGVFPSAQVGELLGILADIRSRAVAA